MTTYKQSLKKKHKKTRKRHKSWTTALKGCPQKRGYCVLILKESPKKPNSANRSVAKIKLTTGRRIRAQIPGMGHDLDKFKRVLIRGGRARDLPGIKYRVMRGSIDASPVLTRRKGFSKYGLKSSKILELVSEDIDKDIEELNQLRGSDEELRQQTLKEQMYFDLLERI